ncbi:hypothetical protein Tco_0805709 [Tanacetum coccineum]
MKVTPPDAKSDGTLFGGVTDWYQEPSYPFTVLILFDTIPTTILDTTPVITPPTTQADTIVIPTEIPIIAPTIPPSPDYTPASPDYSSASETGSNLSKDPSSDHIPSLPAISPFLSSVDDTIDSDTPDTPPSPTHGTPFTKITAFTQRSPAITFCRVMILAHGQPIPYGRPYRYHLNGPVHMMTARKRVGPLPVQQLAMRHSVDHSSSDYFSLDDSARDSSLDSSSEASSDFHSDASSDSSSRHFILLPIYRVLLRDHLISLRGDAIVRVSDGPHLKQDIDLEIKAEIDECTRGPVEVKVERVTHPVIPEDTPEPTQEGVVESIEESETGTRGPVEVRVERVTHPVMPEDTPEPAQEGVVEVTYETIRELVQRFHDHTEAILIHRIQAIEGVQREQGRRIVGAESAVTILTKRVAELERDNRRLRGTASVESQRVDRL